MMISNVELKGRSYGMARSEMAGIHVKRLFARFYGCIGTARLRKGGKGGGFLGHHVYTVLHNSVCKTVFNATVGSLAFDSFVFP